MNLKCVFVVVFFRWILCFPKRRCFCLGNLFSWTTSSRTSTAPCLSSKIWWRRYGMVWTTLTGCWIIQQTVSSRSVCCCSVRQIKPCKHAASPKHPPDDGHCFVLFCPFFSRLSTSVRQKYMLFLRRFPTLSWLWCRKSKYAQWNTYSKQTRWTNLHRIIIFPYQTVLTLKWDLIVFAAVVMVT